MIQYGGPEGPPYFGSVEFLLAGQVLSHDALHGVQDILIAGAAAQVAGDELAQLIPVVLFVGAHDLHGGHDEAGSAEAALDGGLLDKGGLDGGQAPHWGP